MKIENAIKIILKEKPDLIYVNSIVSHAYARIGRKLKIPTILHVHELKESFNSISLEINLNNFKNLADKFIAVSQKVKSFLIKEINCNPKKIVLINEFSSSEEVLKKANEKSIREIHREINKKKDEILIVGIGTACKRKGIDILIKAHKLLKKRGYNNIKIIWTGLLIEEKEIITAILKRDKNFLFLGEKINPFPYLNSADIFVLPSREDPFPLVVLEAMALGKPSIVFKDGGGIPEAVKNCGIIVKKMNSEKLANAILKLSQNKKLIQAFSINCKKKQKEKYDSKIIIPKIYNLIEKELKKWKY